MRRQKRMEDMEKLILIDGNSLLNRAYFATPHFTTKDGLPTNAVFGFIKLFLKILGDLHPEYAVVAFDLRAPTFRHKMYDGYKATRKPMPDDLAVQLPVLKECLSLMNIKICEKEGYEADDVIGSLSRMFPSVQNYIYTGDRDSYQLVNENTCVCFTRKGVSDILLLNNENFREETGLCPAQIIDLKSLMGDSSDNIPGVPGIGEKMAKKLLGEYDDLQNIYAHLDEIKGAVHDKLANNRDSAEMSAVLATIDTKVPLEIELEDCRVKMPFSAALRRKFAALEFRILYADESLYEKETNGSDAADSADRLSPPSEIFNVRSFEEIRKKIENNRRFCVVWGAKKQIYIGSPAPTQAGGAHADASEGSDDGQGKVGTEYEIAEMVDLFSGGLNERDMRGILQAIFQKKENTVVLYGAKDMMHALRRMDIEMLCDYEDVSLLKYLTDYSGREEELAFVLDAYGLPSEHLAWSLGVLYARLRAKAEETGTLELYYTMEKPLCRVLFDMECQGVCIDETSLHRLGKEYAARVESVSHRIHELAGDDTFNINSAKQLGNILFEKLGIKGGKKSKNGAYSSSVDILEKLAPEHEIVREILEYRKIQKLNSTYVEGLKSCLREGRVHTTYMQNITSTGRLSSKNPNLQNIPVRTEEGREIRKLFIAGEGRVLLDADYSQIELRLLAHMSGCRELIDAYRAGKDIHRDTAAKVYGVREEEVTPAMRRSAKAVNFGIIYGESAFGLSQTLDITPTRAAEFIQRYFEAYPTVKDYLNGTVAFAKEHGYVTTLFGRKREIPELKSPNYNVRQFGERAAMNMPLQGSSADIIKIAMIAVWKELKARGMRSRLILQVHDELLLDAPEEEAEEAAELLKECMEGAAKLSVPLTVEVSRGKSWFEAK